MSTISIIPVTKISKSVAKALAGSLTETSKMPCKSYSLPTEACVTGFKMSKIEGSICSVCYANEGFYRVYANTIKPAQHARLDSINGEHWISAMVALIGSDTYFRWHDSGDLQSVEHLEKIVQVALNTPNCRHWLPTREYSMVKDYLAKGNTVPDNLIIRLSAMYVDKPVVLPKSLVTIKNVTTSNMHSTATLTQAGVECESYKRGGKCGDCRLCWSQEVVSYLAH